MHTPDSIRPELSRLLASLVEPLAYCVTRHDEPADDRTYLTEELAQAAAEYAQANSSHPSIYETARCSLQVTVGFTPESGSWGWQTGDNSFTGGAYGHPHWGVAWLPSGATPEEIEECAESIVDQISEECADMQPTA